MKLTLLNIERILLRLHKMISDWRGTSNQIYFEQRIDEYRDIWRSIAEVSGANFKILTNDIWEIELNGKIARINNYRLEFDNPVTLELAGNKPLVHRLLREKGIPVPDHIVFQLPEYERANYFLKQHTTGCVIKPANGYGGKGVTTHVLHEREVRKAAILASLYSRELLMEPQIPGESYRILVIAGKVVHAVCRKGPRLTGDGRSSISDLIKAENSRLKHENKTTLDVGRDCLFTLKYQNLSLDSIPLSGMVFLVKNINDPNRKQVEVRTVYNNVVTDLICNSIKHNAELAAKIIRSEFAGVDVITINPQIPLEESGGVINEINTTPGLHHHYNYGVDKYPYAAIQALSVLFEKNIYT